MVSSGTCAGGPGCKKEKEISIVPATSARGVLTCLLPTYLPIHLVKINNYDETYEAAARPDDSLGYVLVETKIGSKGALLTIVLFRS